MAFDSTLNIKDIAFEVVNFLLMSVVGDERIDPLYLAAVSLVKVKLRILLGIANTTKISKSIITKSRGYQKKHASL